MGTLFLESPNSLALCQIIKKLRCFSLIIRKNNAEALAVKLTGVHSVIKISILICFLNLLIYSISIH